jgi:hypothetical protein
MRREDVQPLLYKAVDGLPEPDLADAAWAAGVDTRRRRRRGVIIGLLLALVIAVIAAIGAGVSGSNKADLVPPPTPSLPPGYLPPAGQIAGIDYWMAPPSGSERFLDRLETPLGDKLRLPDNPPRLVEHPLEHLAAVVLEHYGGLYEPLLLGADSSWAQADVDLRPIRTGAPLSPGTVSPDGRIAAFPQPGELVTVDATTAVVTRYDLPTEDVRSVSWLGDAQRVLVSGPGVAYRVLVGQGRFGEGTLVKVNGAPDPDAVTAPFTLDSGAVMRYMTSGEWVVDSALQLPVRSWVGQTFSTNGTAARLFIANDLPQFPGTTSQPQVLAAISTLRAAPSHLLVLTNSAPSTTSSPPPAAADRVYLREPGCCAVLGWYDDYTPLLQVRGWVLAWDLRSGQVRRLTELAVNGVALGPGIRP